MQCSFCRNDNATNEHKYEGDFVFVMCDDCNARYKEHPKQLGPKYLICNCDPDNPRELDLSMAQSEIKASKPIWTEKHDKIVKEYESKPQNETVIIKKDEDVKEQKQEFVRKVPKKQKRSFPTGY